MKSKLIVVLGMHRSGTSLLSAGLSYIGANFGNELMGGTEFNLKGHWEDNDIVAFNNRVLSVLNITWDSTTFIDDSAWQHNEIKALVDEGVLLLEQKLAINDNRFAFKDPRTIRVLPIWLSIFKKLNIAPRFVVAFRNPLDVGVSLTRREAKPLCLSQLLWMHHHFSYLKDLTESDYATTFIDFYDFCKQPEATLNKLAEFLELSPKSSAIEVFSEEFYDEKLVTKQTDPYQLSENKSITPWVFDCYRHLRLLQDGNERVLSSELKEYSLRWLNVGPYLCSQFEILQQENLSNQQLVRSQEKEKQAALEQQLLSLQHKIDESEKNSHVIKQVDQLLSKQTQVLCEQHVSKISALDKSMSELYLDETSKVVEALSNLSTFSQLESSINWLKDLLIDELNKLNKDGQLSQVILLLKQQSTKQDIASLTNEIKANSVYQPLSEIKEQLFELVRPSDLREALSTYQAANETQAQQVTVAYQKEAQGLLKRINDNHLALTALQKQLNEQAEQQQKIIKLQQEAECAKEAAIKANLRFKQQEQVVEDVFNSLSWRITTPLRWLAGIFLK